ncbi:hypothetical protein [Actinomadura sp. WMMB 499]|uniref:hypothetical protein n=1 Tax=Actinomadura sp. WMMB 499 TaxID=1219491 RepID=UPI00124472E8|nr:hypothetical protein [Actinomadura sp. WMMB 499]QFG22561.1 hypothetical protein F7P10_17000 [Actinomadura sp. WMMB 499]
MADGSLDEVLAHVKHREDDWEAKSARPARGHAAIGCARADVIHWLHRDRELLECARTTQATAFEDEPDASASGQVLRKVAEQLGPQGMKEFQEWAGVAHFWCELLAQMACALERYEDVCGRMFFLVEKVLYQRIGESLPSALHRAGAIGSAVHWTWRYVLAGIVSASGGGSLAAWLASGDTQRLLWPIRVIAVLMCPDASHHPAVRQHCWEPIVRLARAEIRDKVRERLAQVFTEDPWFA